MRYFSDSQASASDSESAPADGGTPLCNRRQSGQTHSATTDGSDMTADDPAICPECGGTIQADPDDGPTCSECGLLLDDGPDMDRVDGCGITDTYSEFQRQSRTGTGRSVLQSDRNGLGSTVSTIPKDEFASLSNEKRSQLSRMRRLHTRRRQGEKRLEYALTEMRRMSTAVGSKKADAEQAAQLFRRAREEDVLLGRRLESAAAACLYASCRIDQTPVLMTDLERVSKGSISEIRNIYSALQEELTLPIPPQNPLDYLPRVASDIGAKPTLEQAARAVLEQVIESPLISGRNPAAMAAGALAAVANLTPSETESAPAIGSVKTRDLAKAANVHMETVRKNQAAFESYLCDPNEDGSPTEVTLPIACSRRSDV